MATQHMDLAEISRNVARLVAGGTPELGSVRSEDAPALLALMIGGLVRKLQEAIDEIEGLRIQLDNIGDRVDAIEIEEDRVDW